MNLLFHYASERIYKDDKGNLYISGNFTDEVWERYLNICDRLDVVLTDSGKVIDEKTAIRTKQKIDTTKINVHLVPDSKASIRVFFSKDIQKQINETNRKLLNQCDFAIVRIANNRMNRMCRKFGKPYAVEVVGCPWDAYWNHGIKGKVLAPYMYLYAKYEVWRAKWVLYVTEKFLQRRYPTKGQTVSCSNVSLNAIDENILAERLAKIEAKGNERVILGTAAALDVRYKGHEYVLRAMAKLKEMGYSNYEYQVVGGGNAEFRMNLSKDLKIEDQFHVIGQIPHDQVFQWLRGIDIYIQPSLQEGLPRSVIEAMSYGLPCVGTNVAGIPELLNDQMIFKKKDVAALVKVLMSLDKKLMSRMAKENFEKSKDYDVNVLKARRQNFYEQFRNWAEGECKKCR